MSVATTKCKRTHYVKYFIPAEFRREKGKESSPHGKYHVSRQQGPLE